MNKRLIPRVNPRMLEYTPDQFCEVLNRLIDETNDGPSQYDSGGGSSSGVNVVQTTGQSTTDVMSQNAVTSYLAGKVNKESGKGLSSNDFTDGEKSKLAGIEAGAQKNAAHTVVDVNYVHTDNNYTNADKTAVGKIDDIEAVIPNQATADNQLADKNFVNSSLNSITAYYITRDAQGDQFNTKAQLDNTTVFYSGGEVRVPTRNDYCIVLADETKTDPITGEDPTTRYIYQNNGWEFQYVVNKTTLTANQLAAINSGITASGVTKLNGIEAGAQVNAPNTVVDANYVHTDNNYTTTDKDKLAGIDMSTKQDVLTAGTNIQISNNTISATDTTYSAGAGISIDANNEISSTIAAQIQSDWAQSDSTATDYIKNKPSDIVYWDTVGQVQPAQPWIETTDIKDEAVTTDKIDDDAVTTAKIDDEAVTTAKIDDDAITTAKILDGAVTAAKLDEHAVIIDKVSDTNGYCLKLADGTMISCQKFKKTVSITTGWGSCYAGVVTPPNYAVAFVSAPTVSISINGYGAAGDSWVASKNGESESTFLTRCGQFNLVRPTSSNSVSAVINIIAIGRWKA